MTDQLFNSQAFEHIPGQMSMEQVEPTFRDWPITRCVDCDIVIQPHPGMVPPRCAYCATTRFGARS